MFRTTLRFLDLSFSAAIGEQLRQFCCCRAALQGGEGGGRGGRGEGGRVKIREQVGGTRTEFLSSCGGCYVFCWRGQLRLVLERDGPLVKREEKLPLVKETTTLPLVGTPTLQERTLFSPN